MNKEIKLINFSTSIEEDKELWQDCVVKAITSINTDKDCVYLMEIKNNLPADRFNFIAKNLSKMFRAKGVDNIVFVPEGMINLKKIEVIHK